MKLERVAPTAGIGTDLRSRPGLFVGRSWPSTYVNTWLNWRAFNPLVSLVWSGAGWADDPLWANPGGGGAVSSWRDGSGNGRTLSQGTGANQPVFTAASSLLNNRGAITFDGSNDTLQSSTFTAVSSGTHSVIAIATTGSSYTGADRHIFDIGNATARETIFQQSGDSNKQHTGNHTGDAALSGAVVLSSSTAYAVRLKMVGASSTTATFNGSSAGTTSTASATINQFTIGGNYVGGSCHKGDVAFWGYYVGDITADPNWSALVAWVASYYGLTLS